MKSWNKPIEKIYTSKKKKACQTEIEMIPVSTQALGDFQNVQTQTDLFETESHTNHSDTHSQIDIEPKRKKKKKKEMMTTNIQIVVILLFTVHVCLCY